MKLTFFTVSLHLITIFISTFISNIPTVLGQCLDFPICYDRKIIKMAPCKSIKEPKKLKTLKPQNLINNVEGIIKGKSKSSSKNNNSSENTPPSQSMIQLDFTCDLNNTTTCAKAKKAFETAINIICSKIIFTTQISVNASFVNLNGRLGAAGPSRFIPLQDKDGITRLYPQALVKQFQFDVHPEYAPTDIIAAFNSVGNTFWFEDDPSPPTSDQVDIVLVIIHELIHGLGLISSWDVFFNPYAPNALTPFPSFILSVNGPFEPPKNGSITFTGFQESAFDKYLLLTADGKPTSQLASQINEFAGGANSGAKFNNKSDFINAFKSSPQFQTATNMFQNAITAFSMGFCPQGTNNVNNSFLIETSLVPYLSGSSITHTDFATFFNTSDFLMVWKAPRGVTLKDLTGNSNDSSPIGPKITKILETLGYKTANNPNPYRPNEPSSDEAEQ